MVETAVSSYLIKSEGLHITQHVCHWETLLKSPCQVCRSQQSPDRQGKYYGSVALAEEATPTIN